MQKLLTSSEAASVLGISRETAAHYAITGIIPASKIGRAWKFKVEDIEQFIRDNRHRSR